MQKVRPTFGWHLPGIGVPAAGAAAGLTIAMVVAGCGGSPAEKEAEPWDAELFSAADGGYGPWCEQAGADGDQLLCSWSGPDDAVTAVMLDSADGEELWRHETSIPSLLPAYLSAGDSVVATDAGTVVVLDAESGQPRSGVNSWEVGELLGEGGDDDEIVSWDWYASTNGSELLVRDSSQVRLLAAETQEHLADLPVPDGGGARGAELDGSRILVSYARGTQAVLYDTDGNELWDDELTLPPSGTALPLPIGIDGDETYFSVLAEPGDSMIEREYIVHQVGLADGSVTGTAELPRGFRPQAVIDGVLYAIYGTENAMGAFEVSTGDAVWMGDQVGTVGPLSPPLAVGDEIYVSDASGQVFKLDRESGDVLWSGSEPGVEAREIAEFGDQLEPPVMIGDLVYTAYVDGMVTAERPGEG